MKKTGQNGNKKPKTRVTDSTPFSVWRDETLNRLGVDDRAPNGMRGFVPLPARPLVSAEAHRELKEEMEKARGG